MNIYVLPLAVSLSGAKELQKVLLGVLTLPLNPVGRP